MFNLPGDGRITFQEQEGVVSENLRNAIKAALQAFNAAYGTFKLAETQPSNAPGASEEKA